MKASLVLTVIAADKPGIVESLSRTVTSHEANWEESRMSRLAGRFAGILRVSVEEPRAQALASALRALDREGLDVVVAIAPGGAVSEPPGRALELSLIGTDRPGIVRDISRVLAARRVNVEELVTECQLAPESGGTLFKATARLQCPASTRVEDLRETLESLAEDLMVDLELTEPETQARG